jgi:hypothetical protein
MAIMASALPDPALSEISKVRAIAKVAILAVLDPHLTPLPQKKRITISD